MENGAGWAVRGLASATAAATFTLGVPRWLRVIVSGLDPFLRAVVENMYEMLGSPEQPAPRAGSR